MDENNLKYWLALKFVEGLGSVGTKNLLSAFGTPRRVLEAPLETLKSVPGIKERTANLIHRFNKWKQVERELALTREKGVSLVTVEDTSYPRLLLDIYDRPPLLYVKGAFVEDEATIAVVGSRAASTYGKFLTERLCRELAQQGFTVVSGMARGIDTAAHCGALSAKGRTIAVLGCGLDVYYPLENRSLYDEIATRGAVVTEYPFGTKPLAANFPMRNRIISGISLGVVVVEATDKSGSLITARVALEQGREVFAVPGTVDSPGSKGTHKLIKEGAKLVENIDDIIEEVQPRLRKTPVTPQVPEQADADRPVNEKPLGERERTILNLLSGGAFDVDTLIEKTGLDTNEVLAILLGLELDGYVEQKPGKVFIRR